MFRVREGDAVRWSSASSETLGAGHRVQMSPEDDDEDDAEPGVPAVA